jgi:hypothetical protein
MFDDACLSCFDGDGESLVNLDSQIDFQWRFHSPEGHAQLKDAHRQRQHFPENGLSSLVIENWLIVDLGRTELTCDSWALPQFHCVDSSCCT